MVCEPNNKNEVLGIIYFAGVLESVDTVTLTKTPVRAYTKTGILPACLITVLQKLHDIRRCFTGPNPDSPGVLSSSSEDIVRPIFWRTPHIAGTVLNLLLEDVDDPIIWVMGEYLIDEISELQMSGLLQSDLRIPERKPGMPSTVDVILRVTEVDKLRLPENQGFSHWCGARIAVFSRAQEPTEVYKVWLSYFSSPGDNILRQLLCEDESVIDGATAFISPYGVEDREHAVVAKAGWSSKELAQVIADRLSLPLLTTNCSKEDLIPWEDYKILPDDLEKYI